MWDRDWTADLDGGGLPQTASDGATADPPDAARAALAAERTGSRSGAWLLTDTCGRPLAISDAAHALLSANLGVLRRHHRRLHSPTHPHLLTDCLARARATGGAAVALSREDRLPLTLRCERLPDAALPGRAHLLITLRDPEAEVLDPALAQAMFGLTPAEARVAAALARGQGTDQIAQTLGVQTNTVLAHIKRALVKTGASRQVELVSLLLRSAAMVASTPPVDHATPATAGDAPQADAHLARLGNDARRCPR